MYNISNRTNWLKVFKLNEKEIILWLTEWKWEEYKILFEEILKKLDDSKQSSRIKTELAWLWQNILVGENWSLIKSSQVESEIERISQEVLNIIWRSESSKLKNALNTEKKVNKLIDNVRYRILIFWVLKILNSVWFDISSNNNISKLKNVNSKIWDIIFHVLKDPTLTTFLMVLHSYWFIKRSKNIVNSHEIEEEVKICNIWDVKSDVIKKLNKKWAKKTFEWTVEDLYYDYDSKNDNLRTKFWDNTYRSTFRIRKKTSITWTEKYYYTIKRKLTKDEKIMFDKFAINKEDGRNIETRTCFEQEFEINNFKLFEKSITEAWYTKQRSKKKDRISYAIEDPKYFGWWAKFDFDKYKGKQDMLEIEASEHTQLKKCIEELWLKDKKRMVCWSNTFINSTFTNEPADDYHKSLKKVA